MSKKLLTLLMMATGVALSTVTLNVAAQSSNPGYWISPAANKRKTSCSLRVS